ANNGDDRSFGFEKQANLVILLNADAFASSSAKCSQAGVLELFAFRLGKKLDVLGVGAGPAAFNVMNPESVEFFGNAEFVHDRKVDAFTLAAIAQGRIIQFHFGLHKSPA